MGNGRMASTLLDEMDPGVRPELAERARIRRLALSAALQTFRARKGWTVSQAAGHAGLAPMTWRRFEDSLPLRHKSHMALERLLEQPFGTVKRALDDDFLMVGLIGQISVETSHVAPVDATDFLATFVEQSRPGSTGHTAEHRRPWAVATPTAAPARPAAPDWPVVDDMTRQALLALAMHVPAVRPTELEIVQRMLERVTARPMTPAIDQLVKAALEAMPDLIARHVVAAGEELNADAVSEQTVEPKP